MEAAKRRWSYFICLWWCGGFLLNVNPPKSYFMASESDDAVLLLDCYGVRGGWFVCWMDVIVLLV